MTENARRNQNLYFEYLRIFSALGIVWFHCQLAGTGYRYAYIGLSVFIILTFYLEGRRDPDRSFDFRGLAGRLMIPWAFWMVAYGAYNFIRHKPILPPSGSIVESLLWGTGIQLWYLPFVFVLIVALRLLRRLHLPPILWPLVSALGSMALLLTVSAWRPWSLAEGAPIAQYAQALLGVLIGYALATGRGRVGQVLIAGILVSAVAASIWAGPPGAGNILQLVGLPYLVGSLLMIGAMWLGAHANDRIADPSRVSQLTFGVYLVHLPILGAVAFLAGVSPYLAILTTFGISLVAVWIIRLVRVGRMIT